MDRRKSPERKQAERDHMARRKLDSLTHRILPDKQESLAGSAGPGAIYVEGLERVEPSAAFENSHRSRSTPAEVIFPAADERPESTAAIIAELAAVKNLPAAKDARQS